VHGLSRGRRAAAGHGAAYFGDPQPNLSLPNAAHRKLILEGAKHWNPPQEYIRKLEQFEVGG
jgi:hypothetical protein